MSTHLLPGKPIGRGCHESMATCSLLLKVPHFKYDHLSKIQLISTAAGGEKHSNITDVMNYTKDCVLNLNSLLSTVTYYKNRQGQNTMYGPKQITPYKKENSKAHIKCNILPITVIRETQLKSTSRLIFQGGKALLSCSQSVHAEILGPGSNASEAKTQWFFCV